MTPRAAEPASTPRLGLSDPPHLMATQAVADQLHVSSSRGLAEPDAARRLAFYGPNRLREVPPRSRLGVFLAQFKSVLILILLGAAGLAALIGNFKDAAVIVAVVLVNALVGFFQEYRAEKSLAALKQMLPLRSRVRRDGEVREINAIDLVPGDVVLLEAGDRVPADGRLLLAARVEIDESALTGESHPAGKQTDPLSAPDAPLGDRANMAYMNTMLTRGRAELVVTATGVSSEMGRLAAQLAATTEAPTPLQVQLDRLGKRLGAIALTLVGLLSFLEFLRGTDIAHIVLDAIALAVAAMPEGLPVVITVTLALGMHKMAHQRAIVRRLASVETLGCTTVICSDKTGTLTLNQMTARSLLYGGELFQVSGEGYRTEGAIRPLRDGTAPSTLAPLLVPIAACNDSRIDNGRVVGDPMEAALLVLAAKGAVSRDEVARTLPRTAEIPFDAAHKFMATFHRQEDKVQVFVKGAPDVLLARCERWLAPNEERALTSNDRERIETEYAAMAREGQRGLLVAGKTVAADAFDPARDLSTHVHGLAFVGLIGLLDPPRPEVRSAIAECRQAGIAVKMITGDHANTGAAIARELGLIGAVLTGAELERLDSDELRSAIDHVAVFARVTPDHKVKIVRALQSHGHVVAMTGDGVNDAPALKGADIGIAMGIGGTAVAKEAATMILTDDNFATIVSAVRQGRTLYDNILKFVRFQLATTIGAILTVFFAPLAGLPEPFTAVQILWVAIIMDGPPAISLALDSARPGIMCEPPRGRAEPVLPFARLAKIVGYGLTMMAGTLTVLHFAVQSGAEARALTLAFTTFVLFQVFNVFNARNEKATAFNWQLFDNKMLWLSLAAILLLQAVAVHWPPAQDTFGTSGLSVLDWGIAAGVAASIVVLEELRKLLGRGFMYAKRQRR